MRLSAFCGCFLLAVSAPAQQTDSQQLLKILTLEIRPERSRDFEMATRKLADANRKSGDRWVAFSTEFGTLGRVHFSSIGTKMADFEAGQKAFSSAGTEAFGPNFSKFMGDIVAMTSGATRELRRRHWELSINAPSSQEERMKTVATSRLIRTIRIDLKPGRMPDFIEAWKPWRDELASHGLSGWVSVTATGTPAVFVAGYFKDMAGMDAADALARKALASQAYRDFMKNTSDMVAKTAWEIHRFRPELSCVPEELANLDPEFWRPKMPTVATRMKKDATPKKQ